MTWAELADLFQEESRKFPLDLHETIAHQPNWADAWTEADHLTESALVQAVAQWRGSRTWPAMSKLEATMMGARLRAASELALLLASLRIGKHRVAGEPPDIAPLALINWCLVDAWNEVGYGQTHEILESLQKFGTGDTPPPFLGN